MFLLITALVLLAGLFVIVLPGGILVAALLVHFRRSPEPDVKLCRAADVTDPASKPCFTSEGTGYCDRHQPLEQAS